MASLLLDALRGLLLGEATDYAKEKAKPYVNEIMAQMQPDQEAITPGARMDDQGYPTMSEMLPAQTSGLGNRQQIPGVTSGAADPRVLQQMYDEIAADQTMREQEVDADWAAENKQNVLDSVRRAGGEVVQERTYPTTTSGESAITQPYTPSGDDSAMFQQKSQDLMQEAQKLKQEAPDATPDQVTAAALVERGKKDPSFFDVMGDKISETFGDEQTWLSLAMAFNTLRFQPDQGLQKALGSRIETLQKNKLATQKAPVIAKQLRALGYPKWADYVLNNPTQAGKIMEQIMQKELKPGAADVISGVQIDPVTGATYIVRTNRQTGVAERIDVANAKQLTPQEEADLESATKTRDNSMQIAQKRSTDIMDRADNLSQQMEGLREVLTQLEKGAETGYFASKLPSFRTSTIALQNAVNQLGLSVIGGTTFGALSESELKFALETAVPTNMNEDELKDWVKRKIAAQDKVRSALIDQANKMVTLGWTDYLADLKKQQDMAPATTIGTEAPAAAPAATPTGLPPVKLKSVRPVGQ
jgi:hypothetical protein